MAKPRSRDSLEETGPQGSCCAGEGLDTCLFWASCGISRSGAQPMQGQHPCPCSISLSSLWYLLALLQDGHGHIWAHLGGGCPGARRGVCSRLPSLLPSPPPILFPTLIHTWAHEDRERRWDFHWGGHIAFLWGKHLGERQGSSCLPSVFTQFLLQCFSYSKALPEQCQQHSPHGQCAGLDPLCKGIPRPSPITGLSAHTSLPATPALTIVS